MYETNEVLNAFRTLLAPLIKEVVLTTIEEQQQAQQANVTDDAEVTVDDTCKQLHTSKVTLWRREKSGYLLPVRIGTKVFYRQSEIDRLKQGRGAT